MEKIKLTPYSKWWNDVSLLDDNKNINIGINPDYEYVNTNKQRSFLKDWYSDQITKDRILNNTGKSNPESLKRGQLLNKHSRSYYSNTFPYNDEGSYDFMNRVSMYDSFTPKDNIAVHEQDHNYQRLHRELFKNDNRIKNYSDDKYLGNPTEIHARLMEVRRMLNKKPGQSINMKEYQSIKNNMDSNREFQNYKDDDMVYWLNNIASNKKDVNNNLI